MRINLSHSSSLDAFAIPYQIYLFIFKLIFCFPEKSFGSTVIGLCVHSTLSAIGLALAAIKPLFSQESGIKSESEKRETRKRDRKRDRKRREKRVCVCVRERDEREESEKRVTNESGLSVRHPPVLPHLKVFDTEVTPPNLSANKHNQMEHRTPQKNDILDHSACLLWRPLSGTSNTQERRGGVRERERERDLY